MGRLFWAHGVTTLGDALVGLFVPIFLYRNGYSLTDIFIFIFWWQVFAMPLTYLAMRLLHRIGAYRAMAVGNFARIIVFGLLFTLLSAQWPLILISLVQAFNRSFYWCGLHASFIQGEHHKKEGMDVSFLNAASQMAGVLAPVVGGLVAEQWNINILYGVAMGLLVAAVVPLVLRRDRHAYAPLDVRAVPYRQVFSDIAANAANGTRNFVDGILWPLLIFFLLPTYVAVGGLASLSVLSTLLISLYVGKREERKGEKHYIKTGVTINNLTNLFRLTANSAGHIIGINLIGGVSNSMIATAFMSRYYRNAERVGLAYIHALEQAHIFATALFCLVIVGLLQILPATQAILVGVALAIPVSYAIPRIRSHD